MKAYEDALRLAPEDDVLQLGLSTSGEAMVLWQAREVAESSLATETAAAVNSALRGAAVSSPQQQEADEIQKLDLYSDTTDGPSKASQGQLLLALVPPWWQHIDRWSGWRGGASATSIVERFSIVDTVTQ